MIASPQLPPAQILGGVLVVSTAYVVAYEANAVIFSIARITDNISWVFLPAAIRMLAVLMLGWWGVVGLFLGSLFVVAPMLPVDPARALSLAALSSLPSLFAAVLVQRALSVGSDLSGMTGRHLVIFGLAGGLANSTAHTLYFTLAGMANEPLASFGAMFVGDTLGTFLLLYAAAFVLRRLRVRSRDS